MYCKSVNQRCLSIAVASFESTDQTHTHTHACTHTRSHAHRHTHTQSHIHTHIHTHTNKHSHTQAHARAHTHTHTHTHTRTHTYIYTHIHTHTHTHTHTHIHTHTHYRSTTSSTEQLNDHASKNIMELNSACQINLSFWRMNPCIYQFIDHYTTIIYSNHSPFHASVHHFISPEINESIDRSVTSYRTVEVAHTHPWW